MGASFEPVDFGSFGGRLVREKLGKLGSLLRCFVESGDDMSACLACDPFACSILRMGCFYHHRVGSGSFAGKEDEVDESCMAVSTWNYG